MTTVGFLIRLHAKPGKEEDVANFLEGVMPLIRAEPATEAFLAIRVGPSEFAIVNAFPDEAGRSAHAAGQAAGALFGRADELFASPPAVQPIDILAAKLLPVAA